MGSFGEQDQGVGIQDCDLSAGGGNSAPPSPVAEYATDCIMGGAGKISQILPADVHYKAQVQGFRRETPVDVKSLVLRVTTVIPCTSAVAAIRPSRTGSGSGT